MWRLCAWVIVCLTLATSAPSQHVSNWRAFRKADGLSESACESVSICLNGKVVVTHRSTISELDGYSVTNFPAPAEQPLRVSETPSGQFWVQTREGLEEWRAGSWVKHAVPEIVGDVATTFFPVKQGRVLFAATNGLTEFSSDNVDSPQIRILWASNQSNIGKFLGLCLGREEELWISGETGLAQKTTTPRTTAGEATVREFVAPENLNAKNFRHPLGDDEGGIACIADCVTNGQKLVVLFANGRWTALPAGQKDIIRAWRARRSVWAISDDSLLVWDEKNGEFRETDEVSARHFYDVAVAFDGTFWLATSDGLFQSMALLWNTLPVFRNSIVPADSLAADTQGRVWFVSGRELFSIAENLRERTLSAAAKNETSSVATNAASSSDAGVSDLVTRQLLPERLISSQAAPAIFPLKNGALLLAGEQTWFQFYPDRGTFTVLQPAKGVISRSALGLMNDGSFCFQSFVTNGEEPEFHLETYDGIKFQSLDRPPKDTVPRGNLSIMFVAKDGDLWFGGRSVGRLHEGKWVAVSGSDAFSPSNVVAFVESGSRMWCASSDKIFEWDGADWVIVRSGFDRINAMVRTRDDSIWIATDAGMFRFLQGAWIENGIEDGLPSLNVRAMCEDKRGRLWAGTARGLALYTPDADTAPPEVRVRPLAEREGDIPEGGTITLALIGRDKWKYTPYGRLLFSYRLDQHDWSPFVDANSVSYTDLSPGKHYFQVRAMDRNGNISSSQARLEFAVTLLWYYETRLLVIALAGLAVALFFASLSFNRHRKLVRSYAEVEQKVAERTRELELANRELLHSQKMNALGTLAAGIAHDFNNILSIIKGSAQIIEDNAENPEKIRTRVDRIKTVVEQGSGVVNAMLGFSRESNGAATVCDLGEVVADTIRLLGDRFHREVEVSFTRGEDLPPVQASKDFLQQILLNFIFNAAEAVTDNKRIIISLRRASDLPSGMVLMPAQPGDHLRVSVQDFGCGISAENLPRVFEPFFTTKALSTRRGTGLGLSMVYELAKKLGAGLAVESVVNRGSTFTLMLPVTQTKQ